MADKEYIEREAAFNAILKLVPKVDDDGYCWVIRGDVARAIDSIPAADVRPVEWIPVKERLPKYGERVLVFGGVTMYVAYYDKNRYGGESWHKLNSKSHYCNPTHWMPLPEPPREE